MTGESSNQLGLLQQAQRPSSEASKLANVDRPPSSNGVQPVDALQAAQQLLPSRQHTS